MDKKEMDKLVELAMVAFDKHDVSFKTSMRRAVKAVLDYMEQRDSPMQIPPPAKKRGKA